VSMALLEYFVTWAVRPGISEPPMIRAPRHFCRLSPVLGCLGPLAWIGVAVAAETPARVTYEEHVRPILKAHCFVCHGEEEKPKAGLDLRLVRTIMKGGVSGEVLVVGRHEESLLWERLEAEEMPPGDKKLSASQKEIIASWIDQGATTLRSEPTTLPAGAVVTEADRMFWSFRPIQRPDLPQIQRGSEVRTPIDAFLLERLEAQGLSFAPEADRRTLIRRVTFDLTGLPPTAAEVEDFAAATAEDPYAQLVERLLASPRYG